MRLRTLGGLWLEGSSFSRPKPLLLLAYLTTEGPRDRRYLSELFWPTASSPMTSLRTALSQLRVGAPGALAVEGNRLESLVACDASPLLALPWQGELRDLAELYPGPFLEGFYLPGLSPELEEWIYTTREHLAENLRDALLCQAEQVAANGDFGGAARHAEEAYLLAGAAQPGPETVERIHRVLVAGNSARAVSLQKEARDYGIELSISASEAKRALGWDVDLPGKRPVTASLPGRRTAFIGRERELLEFSRLLADPLVRLITLTGMGGTGKSRLALQVAQQQSQRGSFADGVCFVELDSLTDPEFVPATIATRIGLPAGDSEDANSVAAGIGSKSLLLVLDNCEHLIDGLGFLSALLTRCPNLKIVATSRVRLRLEEEQLFPLQGLSFSSNGSPDEALPEALQLFEQRAKRVDLGFSVDEENRADVAKICRIVSGSPLGIELAAACVRLMPVAEIASDLLRSMDLLSTDVMNVPDRHRTMRTTLEHSWKLLTAKEQEVLRASSVFAGGFTRAAATRVAGVSIPVLASLVDKSLLRPLPGGRYERHPLLHQFTREMLAERPEDERRAQELHTSYFTDLAERAEAGLRGGDQIAFLDMLENEHDNMRTVLRRTIQREGHRAVRLAAALWQFWQIRGHWTEGRDWLERAIRSYRGDSRWQSVADAEPSEALAEALRGQGVLASAQGDNDAATRSFEESLLLSERLGNKERVAALYNNIGVVALHMGEYGRAEGELKRALSIRRAIGDSRGIAATLNNLGAVAGRQGDVRKAEVYYSESLDLFRALGNDPAVALLTSNLGDVAEFLGDYGRAGTLFAESLAAHRKLGDKAGVAASLTRVAAVARRKGEYVRARQLCVESLELLRQLGDRERTAECLNELALLFAAEGSPEAAVTLWGAMERLLKESNVPLPAGQASEYSRMLATVEEQLGEVGFEVARARGRSLTLELAVDHAVAICTEAQQAQTV